jgi:diguanylate cyclase (GGDEF)-like protein
MNNENPKILVVDADVAVQRLLAKWLGNAGYHVEVASRPQDAIVSIEHECPSILITDWDLPDMNGLDFCRWLRSQELPRYVYTLLLTVHTTTSDMIKGLEAGADDFLRKPIDRNEMLARMHSGDRVLELERRLGQLASCDGLTGLFTQRSFYQHFETEWKRVERHKCPLSVVMMDIDFFKSINDNLGHAAGDRVIQCVARTLEANRRATDVVSRYGGEEFCVLLPETNEAGARIWAERVRKQIADTVYTGESAVELTVSGGVAECLDDTSSPQDLVDMADQALLVAKRTGRNQVVEFKSISETGVIGDDSEAAKLFANLTAGDVMTAAVVGASQADPVALAARHILQARMNNIPVVDQDNNMVGVLSEKDLVANMLKTGWEEKCVGEVMSHNVVRYEVNTPAIAVYEFLCRVSVRSVFVVEDGAPVGIISRTSLLRWFSNAIASRSLGDGATKELPPAPHSQIGGSSTSSAVRTVDAMGEELDRLRASLVVGEPGRDRTPLVIWAVSRLQEMVNDLLASSHYLGNGDAKDADEPDCLVGANAFR